MKKVFVLYTICYIGMIVLLIVVINKLINKEVAEQEVNKNNIGKQVILKKDTLLIIDYSIFLREYSLDNGLKLNKDYCEKIIIK